MEAKILRWVSIVVGLPSMIYIGVHLGWHIMLAVLLAMWSQNCWLNANYVRDLEDSYESKKG